MQQYGISFGFREPYQVLVDAGMVQDACNCKMDMIKFLEGTLHGTIKPSMRALSTPPDDCTYKTLVITQCSIRHLYDAVPKSDTHIEIAKSFERRRCNHHELERPLGTLECLSSVVDPKQSKTNKHRYVVASQDPKVRAYMRTIPGVPQIYINRSVMIMEPMASATTKEMDKEEREKFRSGIKARQSTMTNVTGKRKRDNDVERQKQESESHSDITMEAIAAGVGVVISLKLVYKFRRSAEEVPKAQIR